MIDLISREAALNCFHSWVDKYGDVYTPDEMPEYQAIEALPSAQPEQQWISCSEKPDTDRNVFIARGTHDNMSVCIGHYRHDYEQWYEDRNWFAKCLYDGLYWCEMPPLPEPYAERRQDDY